MPPDRRRLGSLVSNPDLDRWIQFGDDGTVVIRTGKAELGQGIRTAIAAVAADELGVDPSVITVKGPETGVAPNEFVTAGSGSIEQSSTAVRQACAHARRELVARAAERLSANANDLTVEAGTVRSPDGRTISYVDLGAAKPFGLLIEEPIETLPAAERRFIGHGLPRTDLPAKVRGEAAFAHDLTLPGIRHARVVRPTRPGARLVSAPPSIEIPGGGAEVVRLGSFLAVVAEREADAVAAAEALEMAARWEGGDALVAGCEEPDQLEARATRSVAVIGGAAVEDPPGPALDHANAAVVVRARYSKPLLLHGAIGPSAAIATFDDGRLSVWSHSQGVEILRLALADVVGVAPEAVSVVHVDGAGCYGHNGADDAALDAALVAMARPGRPVSLKWTRADEHGWEPASPAMAVSIKAGLDEGGRITSWEHDVYSHSHGARPRPMGPDTSGLLASWYLDPPRARPPSGPSRGFHSGAHRNADPLYDIETRRVVQHYVPGPLRTSSTRGLGAFANVFAIESFIILVPLYLQ